MKAKAIKVISATASLFLLLRTPGQSSQLSITVEPNAQTNIFHSYFFPTRESAEGQVIHINDSMIVCYEFRNLTTNANGYADVFSLGGYCNGTWISLNMQHLQDSIVPNTHNIDGFMNSLSLWIGDYKNTARWHRVSVSITTNGFLAGSIDGTNYNEALLYYSLPMTNMDVMVVVTNTPTSYINTNGVEVRNIWLFDAFYGQQSLSLLCLKDLGTLDFSKQVTVSCSGLKTYPQYYSLFYNTTNKLRYHFATGGTNATMNISLPFFNDEGSIFRLGNFP